MSYRFMRIIVFFDLPTETNEDKREYRRFRKHLITSGFVMMQESVYCKMTINRAAARAMAKNISDNSPKDGLVQLLVITEKQFAKIECIVGESSTDVINDDRRVIII